MAEAVGLAASIIAVVELSAKLTSITYGCLASIKNAPQEARELAKELVSLDNVLNAVRDRIVKGQHVTILKKLYEPGGTLRVCEEELNTLVTALEPKDSSKGARAIERVTWPFKEGRLQKQIDRIRMHKELIELALSTDHLWVPLHASRLVGGPD
jgi:hypothetical protein